MSFLEIFYSKNQKFILILKSNSRNNLCDTNLIMNPFMRLRKWQNKSQNLPQIWLHFVIFSLNDYKMYKTSMRKLRPCR